MYGIGDDENVKQQGYFSYDLIELFRFKRHDRDLYLHHFIVTSVCINMQQYRHPGSSMDSSAMQILRIYDSPADV